jgi:hypothetical protein
MVNWNIPALLKCAYTAFTDLKYGDGTAEVGML